MTSRRRPLPYVLHRLEQLVMAKDPALPALTQLERAVALQQAAAALVDEAVAACRFRSHRYPRHTWDQVAEVVGMTKQGASKRWASADDQ